MGLRVGKPVKILPPLPGWCHRALQGVTYWIGLNRCQYNSHPLGESAIAAQLRNLIQGNLPPGHTLSCEANYQALAGVAPLPPTLSGRARADFAVFEEADAKERKSVPKFIIEVKRGCSSPQAIDKDLRRLADIGLLLPNCRTMLFLVSEKRRPPRFTQADGTAIRNRQSIPGHTGKFRVRRIYRASPSVRHSDTAHYACLIEIYARPAKLVPLKRPVSRVAPLRHVAGT
jgi:hypothetical protein